MRTAAELRKLLDHTRATVNQPPELSGYDALAQDRALHDALLREGAEWAVGPVSEIGRVATGPALAWGRDANRNPPELAVVDRYGHRIDEVLFHPAWHALLREAVRHGLHTAPWSDPRRGAHVARAAGFFLLSQAETGFGCPISMTYSVVPVLRGAPAVFSDWEKPLFSREYDPRMLPVGDKQGALCGMAMTEKQGGSDVRANVTRAEPLEREGEYELWGHKWFCSAPMCDAFLVLARTDEGIGCFFLPRWTPDGRRNRMHLVRLKDKLGNRSNASSEVEFQGAWAVRIGEPGRGVATIIEMVHHTRLDCVIGTASTIRHAVVQAIHHASNRHAFGKLLVDQPLMRNVLADLAVESEAATVLTMRLARSYDEAAAGDDSARSFARLATAVGKFFVCKRGPAVVAEALECLGGNGFVEDSILPRLYRDVPLNSIWEGSGNVICLDVLRTLGREPEALPPFLAELEAAAGKDPAFDAFLDELRNDLGREAAEPRTARRLVERLALALQASLLLRHAPPPLAEAFCRSRLAGDHGSSLGTLPGEVDCEAILRRALPG